MNKFRIHKKSQAQGNYTGHPWLIDFPDGQHYTSNGSMSMTCSGVCCDSFEQARAYMAARLNREVKNV